LFYRFRCGRDVEFIAVDSSKASIVSGHRYFMDRDNQAFLEAAFGPDGADQPRWRLPFFHHPPYTAGPNHNNSASVIESLVKPWLIPAGVRAAFCGHEHNFQHVEAAGIHYFVTGGAGKVAVEQPRRQRFETAMVRAWSGTAHFLLARISENELVVRPIADSDFPLDLRRHVDLERQLGQVVIGPARFVEGALEQIGLTPVTQHPGPGARGAVAGDFVVLHVLGRGDEPGIEHVGVRALPDELGRLLEQAFHADALLALGTHPE
jgi:hypothetical protein